MSWPIYARPFVLALTLALPGAAFDEHEEAIYSGETVASIDARLTRESRDPLEANINGGLPKEFEILPYSCFRDPLCIELPDPRAYAGRPRKVTRGPYLNVAVGLNHTVALSTGNDLRCWGS